MIKCGHCGEKHATVNQVRHCADVEDGTVLTAPAAPGRITEAETIEGLRRDVAALVQSREVEERYARQIVKYAASPDATRHGLATAKIRLLAMPQVWKHGHGVSEGMYRRDDLIYKVQKSPSTGRLYAKQLEGEEGHGSFRYAPGLYSVLLPEHRMTIEEAAKFGALYGYCCVCGRTLTDENSIAAGIGPICVKKV